MLHALLKCFYGSNNPKESDYLKKYTKNYEIYLILIPIVFFGLVLFRESRAYFFYYPLIFILGYWIDPECLRKRFFLIIAAILLRLFVSQLMPFIEVFDDERGYARMASGVYNSLVDGGRVWWFPNPWANMTAIQYYLFGVSGDTIRTLNNFLGIITAFFLRKISMNFYSNEMLSEVIFFTALFAPPLVFVSSLCLKEQYISFLLVLVLLGFSKNSRSGNILALIGLCLLGIYRSSLALFVVLAVAFQLCFRILVNKRISNKIKILGFSTALVLISLGGYFAFQLESVQGLKAVMILTGQDKRGEESIRSSGAEFSGMLDKENLFSIKNIVLIPIRCFYSPSPLRALKSPQQVTFVEALAMTLFLYLGAPYFLMGAILSFKNMEKVLPLLFFLSVYLPASYAILTFAPETFRYSWPDFPIYFMIACYGWVVFKNPWRLRIFYSWWFSVAIFGIFYLK